MNKKHPELNSEDVNNTILEYNLEKSFEGQDDNKKLKYQIEDYRQQLHVLQLKLETCQTIGKDLQSVNEELEISLAQCKQETEKMLLKKEKEYRVEKEEYEKQIADLQINIVENKQEILELTKELKKYKDLMAERSYNLISSEDALSPYKEQIAELAILLEKEGEKGQQLEEKLANTETHCQELKNILEIKKEQLAEKNEALERTREELAEKRMELESLKITPASDTCKGNSLFAEVEDRRKLLLDQLKALQSKNIDIKRALNTKINEVKLLRAEKNAMIRKWETDAIDTLQEKSDLLNNYKSRIVDLENKLKAERKKTNQVTEISLTDDSFNYAQSLLAAKRRDLEQLNKMVEKQAMQMLAQEEANHHISIQLRYWRSKAMSLEAQIMAIKTQLKTDNKTDNEMLLEAIENCTISSNTDFEKLCGDSKSAASDTQLTSNNISYQNLSNTSEKSFVDTCVDEEQKETGEKLVRFAMDTKDTEKKPLKKQPKTQDYAVITITNDF